MAKVENNLQYKDQENEIIKASENKSKFDNFHHLLYLDALKAYSDLFNKFFQSISASQGIKNTFDEYLPQENLQDLYNEINSVIMQIQKNFKDSSQNICDFIQALQSRMDFFHQAHLKFITNSPIQSNSINTQEMIKHQSDSNDNELKALKLIQEVNDYNKEFQKCKDLLKEKMSMHSDQVNLFQSSFSQINQFIDHQENNMMQSFERSFQLSQPKITGETKITNRTHSLNGIPKESQPNFQNTNLFGDSQSSPSHSVNQHELELKDKIEILTLAIVSSICQLSELHQFREEKNGNYFEENVIFEKIEKIKKTLSQSIKSSEFPTSLSVLKQKTLSPLSGCNDNNKKEDLSKSIDTCLTQFSGHSNINFKDSKNEIGDLKTQLLSVSEKIVQTFHNFQTLKSKSYHAENCLDNSNDKEESSEKDIEISQSLVMQLEKIIEILREGSIEQKIDFKGSDNFTNFKKNLAVFEFSSIKRKKESENGSPQDHHVEILKNELEKTTKENNLFKKAIETLSKKISEISDVRLKQEQIISELIQENKRINICSSHFQNKNAKLEKTLRAIKETDRASFNILSYTKENIKNSFEKESHKEKQENIHEEDAVNHKEYKRQSNKDTFEKMLETIDFNFERQGSSQLKNFNERINKKNMTDEKQFVKTPSKNLNELFQFIEMTQKKQFENEIPKESKLTQEDPTLLVFQVMKIRDELRKNEELQLLSDNIENPELRICDIEKIYKHKNELERDLKDFLGSISEEIQEKEELFASFIEEFKEEKIRLWNELFEKNEKINILSNEIEKLTHKTDEISTYTESLKRQLESIVCFIKSNFTLFEKNNNGFYLHIFLIYFSFRRKFLHGTENGYL